MDKKINDTVCEENLFSRIYSKYIQDITNFLYYKYGELLDPHDKAQESFVKLWEHCKDVAPNKAKSFLFTVANNLMLNEIKHQKVVLKHREIKPKDYTNEDPEFILEKKQYLAKYQNALSKLSEAQRVVFLMSRVEGKKHQEIAEILDLTVRAVRKRLYMAVENLRKEIDGI